MTTLMSWGNSEGIKGRCDASCHNAMGPDCECMCGGRFHGRGTNGTLDQAVREFWSEVEVKAIARAKAEGYTVSFTDDRPIELMPLFRAYLEGR
jgi:hypothetical protein